MHYHFDTNFNEFLTILYSSVFIYVLNSDSISECNLHTKILTHQDGTDRIPCPETSVNNYHTTPRNIPQERRSQIMRKIKFSYLLSFFLIPTSFYLLIVVAKGYCGN